MGVLVVCDVLNELKKEMELEWIFILLLVDLYLGECLGKYWLGVDELFMNGVVLVGIMVMDLVVVIVDEVEKLKYVWWWFMVVSV